MPGSSAPSTSGPGPGPLALQLARHSAHVVATDLSPRAVASGRLNAALNGVALDVREGDLYRPVEDDDPFDLLTANLPFVVSPETAYTFRDGGRGADGISREAVSGAAALLRPGGLGVLLCNWMVADGETPTERVVSWLDAPDASAVVIRHSTLDPDAYARRWNEFLLATDAAAYRPAVDRWRAAFEDWGLTGIASGAVIVRRDPQPGGWRRAYEMTTVPAGDPSRQLRRMIDNLDSCAVNTDPEAVLTERLRLVERHRLDQSMTYAGSWQVAPARLVVDDTLGVTGAVQPLATHVLLRLDGRSTLQQLMDETAVETGLDPVALRVATVDTCRGLLEAGCPDR